MLKTLIIGASDKPQRYAYKALKLLQKNNHEVLALGKRQMNIDGVEVHLGKPDFSDIHTVTLYLNAKNQEEYYDYIISLKPKRVIFNPGTENPDFQKKLNSENIEVVEACTLVLLSTNQYET
ncbi:CoA-binding protein [Flavobacterium sp. CS20]|uniref:CoA-binding protein n=1 Tax=Flavobacterium sp. CS20 TaxID=2775246 RepID=UPI001B3A2309|nr:CoA-binding protein [Flavobacterium sp. CS20]QTY27329.1 CoA-binding protein [Flavobacterium sp. CS20]